MTDRIPEEPVVPLDDDPLTVEAVRLAAAVKLRKMEDSGVAPTSGRELFGLAIEALDRISQASFKKDFRLVSDAECERIIDQLKGLRAKQSDIVQAVVRETEGKVLAVKG